MVRPNLLRYLYFTCLLSVACQQAFCQESQSNSASIEKLTSMLKSIDPYRPDAEARGTVKVFGSTSMDALAHGWISGFKKFHPEAQVEVSAAGSEAAFKELSANPSGVAMLSRPVRDEEIEALKQHGLKEPVAFVVAREALGVYVNSSNPVESISGEQLRAIFTTDSGVEQLQWSLLGVTGEWATKPIHLISRTKNSGTQMFLRDFVFGSATMREGISAHVSNAQVLEEVSGDPLSITICGLRCGCGGGSSKPLQLMAGASAIPSDDHAVLSGQYPLTRPLTLVIDAGQTSEQARASREFVRYALGQAGQTQAILVGFFPVDLPLLRAGLQKLAGSQLR